MPRRLIVLGAVGLASLLAAAVSASAATSPRNSVRLTLPATNTAGEAFPVHIVGFVLAPANELVYYISMASCPVAFHTANAVGNEPGAEQLQPGKHGKNFSTTIEPSETTLGTYHFCAYLIGGQKTYARATGKTQTVA